MRRSGSIALVLIGSSMAAIGFQTAHQSNLEDDDAYYSSADETSSGTYYHH